MHQLAAWTKRGLFFTQVKNKVLSPRGVKGPPRRFGLVLHLREEKLPPDQYFQQCWKCWGFEWETSLPRFSAGMLKSYFQIEMQTKQFAGKYLPFGERGKTRVCFFALVSGWASRWALLRRHRTHCAIVFVADSLDYYSPRRELRSPTTGPLRELSPILWPLAKPVALK